MEKHRRLIEIGKNFLIVLLSISAISLLIRSQLYQDLSSEGENHWFSSIFSMFEPEETTTPVQASPLLDAFLPVKIAVYQQNQRYGFQYSPDEVNTLFESMATLFTDHVSSFGTPVSVSEQVFQQALTSTGIYFELLSPLPVSALTLWLSNGSFSAHCDHMASQLVLAVDSNQSVQLFYRNSTEDLCYSLSVEGIAANRLETILSGHPSNGVKFAFEDDLYSQLAPYTMIGGATPSVSNYSVSLLEINDTVLHSDDFLSRFSFSSLSASIYPGSENDTVVRDNSDSLRVNSNGTINFFSDDSSSRYPASGSLWETLETVYDEILDRTLLDWCGDAQIYLSDLDVGDDSTALTFQYSLDGALVECSGVPYAAQFIVSDGRISKFTLYPRTFTSSGTSTTVLPELQAMAAMEALNLSKHTLVLCYTNQDTGTIAAGWVAGS